MVCFEGCYFEVDFSVFTHSSVLNSTIVYKGNSTGQKPGLGTNKVMESLMEASQDECEIVSDVFKYCHCL